MGTDYGFNVAAERMYGLRMGTVPIAIGNGFNVAAERMYGLRMGTVPIAIGNGFNVAAEQMYGLRMGTVAKASGTDFYMHCRTQYLRTVLREKIKLLPLSSGAHHMLVATFFFAMMNIFIKAVSHLPVMELVFFRCGISLIICLVEMHRAGVDWRGTNRKLLFLRGAIGTAALYLYFITIAHMPLGIAVVIQYLSPIFTTILGIFILKEHVRPVSWLFFLISFAGVFLIKGLDGNVEMLYLLIGIASAIGSAFAYITIRTLKEAEHPLVVVFHFQLVGTITGMACSVPVFEMPHGIEWLFLFLIGLFTQLGQVNLTKALQQEKVANVSIINYTGIIYAVLAGFLLFGESYGTGTLMGIALVIGGVLLSMLYR